MSLLLQILLGVVGTLPSFLSSEGVISSSYSNLFSASIAAIAAIIADIKGGGTPSSETQAVLVDLQGEYTAIQQNTSADPNVIGDIAEVSNLIGDAIAGWNSNVDPSTLDVPPAVQ